MLQNTKFENCYQIVYEELSYTPLIEATKQALNPYPSNYEVTARLEIGLDGHVDYKFKGMTTNKDLHISIDEFKKLYETITNSVNNVEEEFWPEEDGYLSRIYLNYTYGVSEMANGDVEVKDGAELKTLANILKDMVLSNS